MKVGFEWDEESKAGINFRRHGVRMPEAIAWHGGQGRLLVVVYTWRGENIRIISARPAEPHERKEYEAER
jgi:uncharacterized DUF497 family protein